MMEHYAIVQHGRLAADVFSSAGTVQCYVQLSSLSGEKSAF